MWSATLLSLLNKAGINNTPIEIIRPYLRTGFTWHIFEHSHKELFNGKTMYEYYDNFFCEIYSSANIGYEKSNIKIYEYVLERLKIAKNTCLIIGDSFMSDIKGGENIGIKSILVRNENIENYKWYCKDLENILEKIEEIKRQ